ncbi:Phosphatidylglycerol/phosphatidylinositol transfer protein [Orobanche minor]
MNRLAFGNSLPISEGVEAFGNTPSVAIYKTLGSEFALFDRWFASVPASTQPNRLYVHSATSHGTTSNVATLLAKGYPQRTIFEDLDDAGISFGIYYQNIPATLFYKNLRKLKYLGKFHLYGLSFKSDAENGKLPSYAVVEQRYMDSKLEPANDDHPSHDVYQGQMFVKEVYETLRASPQWNQTLLVITYDEHGGFYDHVARPNYGVPNPDGIMGPDPFFFEFNRLGVRVPTIVVSPWVNKGTALSMALMARPLQHQNTSILRSRQRLGRSSTCHLLLLRERNGQAHFRALFKFSSQPRTDCPEKLPTPVKIRQGDANEDAKASEFQKELMQLAAVLKGEDIFDKFSPWKDWRKYKCQTRERVHGECSQNLLRSRFRR